VGARERHTHTRGSAGSQAPHSKGQLVRVHLGRKLPNPTAENKGVVAADDERAEGLANARHLSELHFFCGSRMGGYCNHRMGDGNLHWPDRPREEELGHPASQSRMHIGGSRCGVAHLTF